MYIKARLLKAANKTGRDKVQSWTKGWKQIHEIKQNMFSYKMFHS